MKAAIIGLGESVNLYKGGYDVSIGVNDTWRKVKTDVIVCVDKPSAFNGERLSVINNSKPKAFYSQIVKWDERPDFRYIKILPGYPDRYIDIKAQGYYKSYFSPFVAIQIAFKEYDAREIHLFGVDMTNHPHLKGDLCHKIKLHFNNLREALEKEGCKIIVHGNGILT